VLGVISYELFLWHLTVTQFLALPSDPAHFSGSGLDLLERLPWSPSLGLLCLTLAVTIVLAAASYYIAELPFLRMKERRGGRALRVPRRSSAPPG
jgi:peptidoglycan/LPS O-acetylase OafA/YrhL